MPTLETSDSSCRNAGSSLEVEEVPNNVHCPGHTLPHSSVYCIRRPELEQGQLCCVQCSDSVCLSDCLLAAGSLFSGPI